VRGAFWLVLGASIASACSKSSTPSQRTESPPATVASADEIAKRLGMDGAALEEPIVPLAPPGDLRADIERFTTLDACVAERGALDPLLGDALRAISYETFARDACRILDAAKARDARKCEPIDASALRARCQTMVALVDAQPDECPFYVPARPAFGRDPGCLAATTGDARVCGAADKLDRPTCQAIATRDASRCDALGSSQERASCRREAARIAPIVPPPDDKAPAPTAPWGKLTIGALDDSPPPQQADVDLATDASRGVVLFEQIDGAHFDLGTPRDTGTGFYGNTPLATTSFFLAVVAPTTGKDVRIDRCELGLPGQSTLVSPGARCSIKTTVDTLARVRGGDVRLRFDGVVGTAPRGYTIHAEVTTFVRDLVKASALAPALGAGRADGGAP
jgi:hypothetical protein